MRSDLRRGARTAAAIAATYAVFLLCAQFGFLAQLEARLGGSPDLLRAVLLAMGAGGIAGSALAARGEPRPRLALLATAAAAALSTLAGGALTSALAAAALGGALGFATVTLAGRLASFVPDGWAGRTAGAGTGLAYALSNLPPLFTGPPWIRALLPAALCALAALRPPLVAAPAGERSLAVEPAARFAGLAAAFAALVAVDSAAFARVQAVPALAAASWAGPAHQLRQGCVHLLAALVAGSLLDRGRLRGLLVVTGALFLVAIPALARPEVAAAAAVLYATGISFYSAALVAAPSIAGGVARGPARAAWLYVVAGWVASGAGVAAARSGHLRAVAFAAAIGGGCFVLAELARRAGLVRSLAPAAALGALASLAGVAATAHPADESLVARGREVYLAEGCQHCHSQYVRAGTLDELWWGPHRAIDRGERPPTPGNRRIGPDLANVGLRRSDTWQELHLRDPRAVSPASRMPSYAHLFAAGGEDGRALVAYLGSLGAAHEAERARTVAAWRAPAATAGDPGRGAALFARHCAPCHGPAGRGDGVAARGFARPTMDLARREFTRAVPARAGESRDEAIARAIRFGLPPGTMAGHEWLDDRELADLVAFVRGLQRAATAKGGEG